MAAVLARFALWAVAAFCVVALLALSGLRPSGRTAEAAAPPTVGDVVRNFATGPLKPARTSSRIPYDLDPRAERFYVHVPNSYSDRVHYGLIVYIDPSDQITAEPSGWADVLDRRRLLFVAPLNAGNDQAIERRWGLGVLAALEMMRHYSIDPNRVYVSGLSGGARVAGQLGFFQPDVFRGTIQNCGADFYQHVPKVLANSDVDTNGHQYGFLNATPNEVAGAKSVRFALITGSRDFRHGNILDLYNGGFAKSGLRARLFDVSGMGHQPASPATLEAALDFVEGME